MCVIAQYIGTVVIVPKCPRTKLPTPTPRPLSNESDDKLLNSCSSINKLQKETCLKNMYRFESSWQTVASQSCTRHVLCPRDTLQSNRIFVHQSNESRMHVMKNPDRRFGPHSLHVKS